MESARLPASQLVRRLVQWATRAVNRLNNVMFLKQRVRSLLIIRMNTETGYGTVADN